MSWFTLRVGDSFTDMRNYNRVRVERVGPRAFLVGTLKSGKVIALYAVRPEYAVEDVSEVIERAIGSSRPLVVLTRELVEIEDDEHARLALEDFRNGGGRIELPNKLAGAK